MNWEYQVIRLNIEPPVSQTPADAPQSESQVEQKTKVDAPPAAKGGMFSEAYLKEEFPRFYDSSLQAQQAAAQAQQQADPAFQLQDFLNAQGQQGWELVGFQHAQPHVFIIFKRPAAGQEAAVAAQSEQLRLTLDLANRALSIIEKQAG
jgi:hypothetical protein